MTQQEFWALSSYLDILEEKYVNGQISAPERALYHTLMNQIHLAMMDHPSLSNSYDTHQKITPR